MFGIKDKIKNSIATEKHVELESAPQLLSADDDSVIDTILDSKPKPISNNVSTLNRSLELADELKDANEFEILPKLDFEKGVIHYPALSLIHEPTENISFLESMVHDGILEKKLFEKLLVCPDHPDSFSTTVRLSCPQCNSLNIEKLQLMEHKKCGFITTSDNFVFDDSQDSVCPSCNKSIKNFDKEIRISAMWHQCNDCSGKFDNVTIKMFCHAHHHDFETNSAQFVPIFSYKLQKIDSELADNSHLKDEIVSMLDGWNYSPKPNFSIQGKSGTEYLIPILATLPGTNKSILFFILNSENFDNSTLNSVVVPTLDILPVKTLIVTTSTVKPSFYDSIKQYPITIISETSNSKIISDIEHFVSALNLENKS